MIHSILLSAYLQPEEKMHILVYSKIYLLGRAFHFCMVVGCFVTAVVDIGSFSFRLWASCQIRKIAGAHAPGMPGTFSPSPQVSDPDMHHGTCVTHVP